MADNVELNSGSGGAVVATDDVTGVHYPINKLAYGVLDSATLVSTSNGLPVQGTVTANLGATDNAVLDAIQAATEKVDDAISGSEMQVDVVAALPAGTNAIGKLAANSGVDIGDVDVTSVPAPLNVVGGGTEAAAQRVTIANDSTGVVSVDDNGGALTVDGTVTANLSAVDNAVLDAIQAAVEISDNAR